MSNETKIFSRRDAVEILGKLYARQVSAGAWKYLSDDEMNALNAAIFALEKDEFEQEQKNSGWTPIENGMPPVDGWYLVTIRKEDGGSYIDTDLYQRDRDGGFLLRGVRDITAWMAKEPYKGGATS